MRTTLADKGETPRGPDTPAALWTGADRLLQRRPGPRGNTACGFRALEAFAADPFDRGPHGRGDAREGRLRGHRGDPGPRGTGGHVPVIVPTARPSEGD